jgi:hypothetical protein
VCYDGIVVYGLPICVVHLVMTPRCVLIFYEA